MASAPLPMPAFGQADLSNCEREQIHLAGSIQPHGALLVVREPDHIIIQTSANAGQFLGIDTKLIGLPLAELDPGLISSIQRYTHDTLRAIPAAVRCQIGAKAEQYDCLLHRPPEGGLVLELERAAPPVDLSRNVETSLRRIIGALTLRTLCDETAAIMRELTGYDRVMVYRFDDQGHGEVFSEIREPHLEAFLGNRYPASDIPQMARRLYERNRVRVLADVHYAPVPLEPRLSPLSKGPIDMSLCFLRSMSPIHIQYLKNMGVCATLVVSLVVGGRLWGLIACHHYKPRFVHFEVRSVCELLAEAVSTRVAALESFVEAQSEIFVRRLEQRMVEAISREGDWKGALFDRAQSMLQPLNATGAALIYEGEILTAGEVPGTQEIRDVGIWLDRQQKSNVFATNSLGLDEPKFEQLIPVASGCVAAPISSSPGDYLLWFRPERVRTVTWGGDPQKPVLVGNDPMQLSPRLSFAQWHQVVEGTCEPWSPPDLAAARLIGETVSDVVLQFRSVRMLIAQDQLDNVSRQVSNSENPVIIADPRGRILLTNEAFERLLPATHPHIQMMEDLTQFFAEPADLRRALGDLLKNQRSWRGEITLQSSPGAGKPLLLRADPVMSAPGRTLGFSLLFTDLTERKAADSARRGFQEGLLDPHRFGSDLQINSESDLVYQNLMSSVVENAQLSALEITSGVDTARIPVMLQSVRASVGRAAQLLRQLISHSSKVSK